MSELKSGIPSEKKGRFGYVTPLSAWKQGRRVGDICLLLFYTIIYIYHPNTWSVQNTFFTGLIAP